MSDLKTKPTEQNVQAFVESIEDEARRRDCIALVQLMHEVTGEPPKMWGESIVGFGSYRYKYESGREGDWFPVGFSPRKKNLTLYFMSGFEQDRALMSKLGKHKTGKACIYINRLADINLGVLRELVKQAVSISKSE